MIHPWSQIDFTDDDEYESMGLMDIDRSLVHNKLFKEDTFLQDPAKALVSCLRNTDYLHFATKFLLGVDLFPYQVVILEKLWKHRLPLLIGGRGSSKTMCLGIYALLRMIFDPGCRIVAVGSGFRQSKQIIDVMIQIWETSPILRDISGNKGGPKQEVDRYTFRIGASICVGIPLGSGDKIRGLRANYILSDEFPSIDTEIFNVVVTGFGAVSSKPRDKVKQAYTIEKMKKKGVWSNSLEVAFQEQSQGNQIVRSGTAFYSFNHFAKTYETWKKIIMSRGNPKVLEELFGADKVITKGFNIKDYCIIRIPYTAISDGYMDDTIIAQAKATLTNSQFLMEFGSSFQRDSDGFFKRTLLESCTTNKPVLTPFGKPVQFLPLRQGIKDRHYIMGVDPARSQDNAAITILEEHPDHRRIVYCWSINKKGFNELKSKNLAKEDDYYKFLVRRMKDLMMVFNVTEIVIDSQGGGATIAEALSDRANCNDGELPIYEIPDPEDPKQTDHLDGLHLLKIINPTNEFNADANYGMLKDFEARSLLFPAFDVVEIARMGEMDNINNVITGTYEDLIEELEELKNEITTITAIPTSTGKERFDVPEIKVEGSKRGRMRKDRYSSLLYCNKLGRDRQLANSLPVIKYQPVGGSAYTMAKVPTPNMPMYSFSKAIKGELTDWISAKNVKY